MYAYVRDIAYHIYICVCVCVCVWVCVCIPCICFSVIHTLKCHIDVRLRVCTVTAGSQLLIRTISMQTFYTVMTSYGARMGTAVIAAHAIARQCASLEALVSTREANTNHTCIHTEREREGCEYVFVYVCRYVYVHMCVYVYIYIYIHTHIICISMLMWVLSAVIDAHACKYSTYGCMCIRYLHVCIHVIAHVCICVHHTFVCVCKFYKIHSGVYTCS